MALQFYKWCCNTFLLKNCKIHQKMLTERDQIPRQHSNVGIDRKLSAFKLSAPQVRLEILNPWLSIEHGANTKWSFASHAPTGWSYKKTNTSVEYNWESPWTPFNQAIITAQRWCAFQPTEEDSGDAIDTFYHRKGHVNAREGDGAAVNTGCNEEGYRIAPRKEVSIPIPAQILDL